MSSRVVHTNLTQECLKRIRSYIAEHDLHAGDRLPTLQEWHEELGVSMVVVREAFTTLRALGLVEIHQGRGVFLRGLEDINFADILTFTHSLEGFSPQDVIESRAMLELTALELCIARASEADIAELEAILPLFDQARSSKASFLPAHKRFHQSMLRMTGNRFLEAVGMPLLNTYWLMGNAGALRSDLPSPDEMTLGHARYIEAIRERDSTHTRELVDQHLLYLCSRNGIFPYAAPSSALAGVLAAAGGDRAP